MKKFILQIFIVVVLISGAIVWQYFATEKILVRNQKPMRIEMVLDQMDKGAEEIAIKTDYIYIGSSNQPIKVVSAKEENNQIHLILQNEGVIYSDSAFFGGQRLVYNTKTKVHSLFDGVGTVVKIEYQN
jgi:hypothetical protein